MKTIERLKADRLRIATGEVSGWRWECDALNALPEILALVEAQAAEIEAWRTAEEECRAIENACDMNAARAYIAKSREKTDAALRALEGGSHE